MKITKNQLRQIIRESIAQQLYVIPDHQLKKLYQYYTGRKSDHLQAISLADAYKIDHAGLIGQIMDWLNKGGHVNADSDGYEFAYSMGYNFMEFYGDDHPVDAYAFAPYEREFEEGAYEYLVDEVRKTDRGPQGYGEDMSRGERIIEEEYARIIKEAPADPKIESVAGMVQAELDRGKGDIFTLADVLQASGLPAEYMSGMGMRYVQIPHKRGHIVIISKNSVEADSETVIVGPYAIGYMGES